MKKTHKVILSCILAHTSIFLVIAELIRLLKEPDAPIFGYVIFGMPIPTLLWTELTPDGMVYQLLLYLIVCIYFFIISCRLIFKKDRLIYLTKWNISFALLYLIPYFLVAFGEYVGP